MTPKLRIDPDAAAANWQFLASLHGAPTAAVVKADAYGLGAARLAPALYAAGARDFFVASLSEALALRRQLPDATIAVLHGFAPRAGAEYLAHDLHPVLGTLAEIGAFTALARDSGRRLAALLHIDTGMNRLGLEPAELDRLEREPERLAGLDLRAVMTHLAHAEDPAHPDNAAQLARFEAARRRLPAAPVSLVNSSGIFLGGAFRQGLARPGAALYGVNPTPGRPNPMRPVLRLTAPVLQIREVPAGATVGYNGTWTAPRPTRVATVAAGYADGYHRGLSNRAEAAFDGARLPLIGRVSMDLTTFDATGLAGLEPGSEVELIGPAVPPDEVALWAGTNGYEVLTSLGSRALRSYGPL